MTINRRNIVDPVNPDTFMAIDASTNSLAFSIFTHGKLVRYGKIRFAGADAFYKAGDAAKKCIPFFREYQVDAVVIEGAIYSNSAKTAMQLSLVQGAIIASAQVSGIKIVKAVSPMEWQNFIGTKLLTADEKKAIARRNPGHTASWYKTKQRETRKQKTITSVNKNFNIKVSDDDVADSIGLGWFVSDRWNTVFNGKK